LGLLRPSFSLTKVHSLPSLNGLVGRVPVPGGMISGSTVVCSVAKRLLFIGTRLYKLGSLGLKLPSSLLMLSSSFAVTLEPLTPLPLSSSSDKSPHFLGPFVLSSKRDFLLESYASVSLLFRLPLPS
jgi:hypothetical protein